MKLLSTIACATLSWLCVSGGALADSRLLVLGASAPTEVPEFDASIVNWARTDSRFRVIPRVVRPDTAQRDARCAAFDDGCLARIADRRDADRILYSTLSPAVDDPERMDVTLRVFDRYTGRTRESSVGSLELDALDDSRELEQLMETLVPSVLAVPEEGAAIIRATAGSEIELDGRSYGAVPASGELELRPVPVGRRVLRVVRDGQPAWESPIVVRARHAVRVTVGAGSTTLLTEPAQASAHATDRVVPSPPDWVHTIPSDESATTAEPTDPFSVGIGVARVRLSIPLIDEHVQRGEIRAATTSRVGFLPNVSSAGARVTAKLRF